MNHIKHEYDPTEESDEGTMYCLDVEDSSDSVKYSRILHSSSAAIDHDPILPSTTPSASSSMSQQHYYVINNEPNIVLPSTTNNLLIAPKIQQCSIIGTIVDSAGTISTNACVKNGDKHSATQSGKVAIPRLPGAKSKVRDERRRVTHNEVERRRRDKINHWIEKLGQLIPVDGQPDPQLPLERPHIGESSKSEILSKACDYVNALHRKINTLDECKRASERIGAETKRLRDANQQLAIENDQLRERLRNLGVSTSRNESIVDRS